MNKYNGKDWGGNGPSRFTTSIKEYCDNLNDTLPVGTFGSRHDNASKITHCVKNNITEEIDILGPTFTSLVHWADIENIFEPQVVNNRSDILSQFKAFESIGTHLYTKITKRHFGRKYANQDLPFKKIFFKNCPITYNEWYN